MVRAPGEVLPGERTLGDARHRTREHDLAAALAARRARAPPCSRRRAIASRSCSTTSTVLPASRRRCKQAQQPVHVARVQADRRLVEHVQRVDELRAERVGEPDALRLAAGERARRPVQREVVRARRRRGTARDRALPSGCARRPAARTRVSVSVVEPRDAAGRRAARRPRAIVRPAMRTCSASGLSFVPWHVGHSCAV